MFNKLFGRSSSDIQPIQQPQQTQQLQQRRPLQPKLQAKGGTQPLRARETREDLPVFDVNDFQLENSDSQRLKAQSSPIPAKTSTAELAETMEELSQLNRSSILFHQESSNNPYSVSEDILKLVNSRFATEHNILPVGKNDTANTITLLYSTDSLKEKANSVLVRLFQGKNLEWLSFDEEILKELIHDYYYGKNSKLFQEESTKAAQEKFSQIRQDEVFSSKKQSTVIFDYASKVKGAQQNHILEIIKSIVCRGDQRGATDINITHRSKLSENGEVISILIARAKIDGRMEVLEYQENIERELYDAFPQVTKILSGKDFTNYKSTDTGKFRGKISYGKKFKAIEVRCQFMPCGSHGIGMSMRIQAQFHFDYNIDTLGLTRFQIPVFRKKFVDAKQGMNLFNGKINKGKQVSLVSSVKEIINKYPHKEILSIEDPIEFILDGVTQAELEPGQEFSDFEKPIMRFTPEVVIVGEIRDDKTAQMVIRMAQTGTVIKSTIHSTTSCDVPDRLERLGVPRYDVAQNLNCVSHQTLLRKACTQCVRVADTNPVISEIAPYIRRAEKLGFKNKGFIKATGFMPDGTKCSKCDGSGYCNRTGVFELLVISRTIRKMIQEKCDPFELRRQALVEGMHSQFMSGLGKCMEGETTLEELFSMLDLPTPEEEGLDMNLDADTNISYLDETDLEDFSN